MFAIDTLANFIDGSVELARRERPLSTKAYSLSQTTGNM